MKRIVFFIAVLLFTLNAFGQGLVFFQETTNELYHVGYNTPGPNQAVIDFMIKTIGEGNGSTLTAAEWEFEFDQNVRMQKLTATTYKLSCTLGPLKIYGNTLYRSFDIHSYLIPESLTMDIEIRNRLNKTVKIITFEGVKADNTHRYYAETIVTDSSQFTNHSARFSHKDFDFTHNRKRAFQDFVNHVNEYYGIEVQITDFHQQLDRLNPMDIDQIFPQEKIVVDIENSVAQSRQSQAFSILNISAQNDPAHVIPKLDELARRAERIHIDIQGTIANLPALFYDRGLALQGMGNFQGAQIDFNKSIQLNPLFAPSHFELARMDLERGQLEVTAQRMIDIYTQMNPDPTLRNRMKPVARDVKNEFHQIGTSFLASKQYNEAIRALEKTGQFCQQIPDLNCSSEVQEDINRAHNGIFHSLLDQAESELTAGNFDRAENKVQEASDYRRKFPAATQNGSRIDVLSTKIHQSQYDMYVQNGKYSFANENFRRALDDFEQANKVATQYPVQQITTLRALIDSSAKSIVLQLAEEGRQLASRNQLAQARDKNNQARDLSLRYGLSMDDQVSQSFQNMNSQIASQECINAQRRFDQLGFDAESKISGGDYLTAETLYDDALRLASKETQCGIDDTRVLMRKKEILPAIMYQNTLEKAKRIVDNGDFAGAIKYYQEAGDQFDNNQIGSFGLTHTPLFTFIKDHRSLRFISYASRYYTDRNEEINAIVLLRKLAAKKYPKTYYKPTMVQVGLQLAMKDHKRVPNSNPKTKVLDYTKGDKYLNILKSAYIKNRKKLQK